MHFDEKPELTPPIIEEDKEDNDFANLMKESVRDWSVSEWKPS